ncbi:MAG TPA: ring-cleaving dioxygenase [Rhabdaerophilum sp.]|nr:ring-cleaving dioxygenase [Rhabdaerophilum sp.]
MQLHGIHHLTAITADARANYRFYCDVLGLRLVKKTVNQDDVSAYHLFYADADGTPGTDLTFFEWPMPRERRGTHAISRTYFRIPGDAALRYWRERIEAHGFQAERPTEINGRAAFAFDDPEGQRLGFVVDPADPPGTPWAKSPVPAEFQIKGLGPIELSVPRIEPTEQFVTLVYGMRKTGTFTRKDGITVHVYAMGGGGAAAELHIAEEPHLAPARQGAGGVHHVAFRTKDAAEYAYWVDRYTALGLRSSGPVDRFYFRSLYIREPNGILFEIATDGPGFHADEPKESMGTRLSLPPFLEGRRAEIEAGLAPLAT